MQTHIKLEQVSPLVNQHYLPFVYSLFEYYQNTILNDWSPSMSDPVAAWDFLLGYISTLAPWFFVVTDDSEPVGILFAENWVQHGDKIYSCEIGGLPKRKVKNSNISLGVSKLLEEIFEQTSCYAVRTIFEDTNRASRMFLRRMKFRISGGWPAHCIRNGQECTAMIGTITRPEFEASLNG